MAEPERHPTSPDIDPATVSALCEALEDECRARATYRRVIEKFGPVRPFVNIVEAEGRHAAALLAQFQRLGLTPPPDTWAGRDIALPDTLAEICAEAVKAEIENAALYDRLLAVVRDPEIREVMRRLQEASQERHLLAFKRCQERERGETPEGEAGCGGREGAHRSGRGRRGLGAAA